MHKLCICISRVLACAGKNKEPGLIIAGNKGASHCETGRAYVRSQICQDYAAGIS